MIPFLSSPETRELVVPVSREFYQEAGKLGLIETDVELIQGLVIKKMPKSPFHILLVRRLIAIFELALGESPYFVAKEDPIGTKDSEPEPDIAVIEGGPDDFVTKLPETAELVVEVAVSTLKKDQLKAEVYAAAGVKEYWILNAEDRCLERLSSPDSKQAMYLHREVLTDSQMFTSLVFPQISVDPVKLFSVE
ncbi:MAG: Uma2 family endonuclease [Verrucomicrobiales bacterium]|nr:Uma2 family endonuclease [Verrucomicrobiales bacterium]